MTVSDFDAVAVPAGGRACEPTAGTAEGCPPRLIGGEQNKTPNPQGADQTINKALDGLEDRQQARVYALTGQSPQNLMYDGYVEAGKQFQQRGGVVGGGS